MTRHVPAEPTWTCCYCGLQMSVLFNVCPRNCWKRPDFDEKCKAWVTEERKRRGLDR